MQMLLFAFYHIELIVFLLSITIKDFYEKPIYFSWQSMSSIKSQKIYLSRLSYAFISKSCIALLGKVNMAGGSIIQP